LYIVWIRVDATLPWIELAGEYETKRHARTAARESLAKVEIRIIKTLEKRRQIKELVTVRR
jgi:hypothetical protein